MIRITAGPGVWSPDLADLPWPAHYIIKDSSVKYYRQVVNNPVVKLRRFFRFSFLDSSGEGITIFIFSIECFFIKSDPPFDGKDQADVQQNFPINTFDHPALPEAFQTQYENSLKEPDFKKRIKTIPATIF